MRKAKLDFRLLVITDRTLSKEDLLNVIGLSCKSGVKAFQLREKDLSSKDLLGLSKKIQTITKKYKALLLINDRLDIALLSGADGIHSPEGGIEAKYDRISNPKLITGKSVHSLAVAKKAEKDGYDYLLFGPVFHTPAKIKFGAPQGIEKLKKLCSSVRIPVFAVGGISPLRAKQCLQAGAHGIAVIRAVMRSKNIRKTVNDFRLNLGGL